MVSAKDWDLLPGRFGFEPAKQSEWRDLLTVLRRAVDTGLTPRHDGLTGTVREDVVRIHGAMAATPRST
jgi:hypothetical protein